MSHLYLCDGGLRLRARIACIFREKESVAFGQHKGVVVVVVGVVSNERDTIR